MSTEYKTIGQVVKALQEQYPDLTVSKVRYLEDEGLISPKRSASGYRKFSPEDFKRLEKILYLQTQYFYPLSVIKKKLDEDASKPLDLHSKNSQKISVQDELKAKLHPLENIPSLIGVDIGFVRKLAEFGLIKFSPSPKGRTLVDGKDFELILACHELRRYGIQPRHLKPYAINAHRDSVLFEQALNNVIPKLSNEISDQDRVNFHTTFERLDSLTSQIRTALIVRDLQHEFKNLNL
ncbi:MAG: MerR family transcriptional regulator [Coriobacteriia bacterium]|nr:MerR family transcriptional regulator [Coriobacteriia bacterium]